MSSCLPEEAINIAALISASVVVYAIRELWATLEGVEQLVRGALVDPERSDRVEIRDHEQEPSGA